MQVDISALDKALASQAWFDYRDQRNLTSHTYDAVVAQRVYACVADFKRDADALLAALKLAAANDD
jgi:hypothetical protein